MTARNSNLSPSGAARALDCLVRHLEHKRGDLNLAPQVLQGQGDLQPLFQNRSECLLWHFPNLLDLDSKHRRWLLETIARFFRGYFRCLSVCFPLLEVEVGQGGFDLSCGRELRDLDDYITLFKDLCTSPLSFGLRNSKDLLLPVYGPARGYLRAALRRHSSRAMTFCNTALQLKRVCPRVPDIFVQKNLEKHRSLMTCATRQGPDFIRIVGAEADRLWAKCDFLGVFEFPEGPLESISSRATIENPGGKGGGFGYYQDFPGDIDRAGNFRPVVRHFDATGAGVSTYRAHMFPTYQQLNDELTQIEQLTRKVVAIPEPLKVRTITIHHACETNLFGSWQQEAARRISHSLKDITSGRCQRGIDGEVVVFGPEDFQDLDRSLELMEEFFNEPCVIVSDDASAATDSLSPELSDRCSQNTWSSPNRLFSRWTGTIHYPESSGLDPVQQINGQLMGDRRSFPTLCIIHLAAKHAFLRQQGVPRRTWFVRVNGDDGLIVLPRSLVDRYFDFMSELWSINLMKTYVSPRFFSFNSALFDRRSHSVVPILRFNIADGVNKNGESSDDPRIFNCMISEAPSWAREDMVRFFVGSPVWRPILQRATQSGVNWFLPLASRGLGLRYNPRYVSPLQKTALISSLRFDDSFTTKMSRRPRFDEKLLAVRLPRNLTFEKSGLSDPAPRRIKPYLGKTRIVFPRAPRVRTWRDLEAGEIDSAWELRADFEQPWGNGLSNPPGASLEFNESNSNGEDQQKKY